MYGFFGLISLISIALSLLFPLLAIVSLVRIAKLSRRVGDLELRLRASQMPHGPPPSVSTSPAAVAPNVAEPVDAVPPPAAETIAEPAASATAPEVLPYQPVAAEMNADGSRDDAVPGDVTPPIPLPPLRSAAGLEERIGGRLSVWVGALALLLASGFLVKYSIEHDLLRPGVRVAMALVTGLVLLGGGELLRQRASRPAEGLVAGGIGMLYMGLFAAATLYELIGPTHGFLAMALVTAAAVSLSLRHGQIVAFVGLVGGFAVPALVSSRDPSAAVLFSYLALLQAGLAAVARHRNWPYLLGCTAGGALGWAGVWLAVGFRAEQSLWFSLYLIASLLIQATATGLPGWRAARIRSIKSWPATIVVAVVAALLQASLLVRQGYDGTDWWLLGLLCAGAMLMDRFDPRYRGLSWFGAALPLVLLNAWREADGGLSPEAFATTALLLGVGFAGGAFACGWGTRQIGRWMSLAVAVAAIDLGLAWYTLPSSPLVSWGVWCLVLATIFLAALAAVQRAETAPGSSDAGLSALAVGVTGFVSLAVPFELAHSWIAVAWAIEVLAIARIEAQFRPLRLPDAAAKVWPTLGLPVLRLFAALLTLAVLLAAIWIAATEIEGFTSEAALWRWLLLGLGLSSAAIAAATIEFLRRGDDAIVVGLELSALWLLLATILLAVLILFAGQRVWQTPVSLMAAGTLAVAGLAYGIGLDWLRWHWTRWAITASARAIGLLGIAVTLLGPVLWLNPLWSEADVGRTALFNGLLWIYGVPAAAAGYLGWRQWRVERWSSLIAISGALLFAAVLVMLEIRHWFHPDAMDVGAAGDAEHYAYSIAALLFGGALMAAGVFAGQARLRQAALAVIGLAVCKVFIYDAAALQGLYRVASFFGLGLALIGLGYVYQRLIARTGKT